MLHKKTRGKADIETTSTNSCVTLGSIVCRLNSTTEKLKKSTSLESLHQMQARRHNVVAKDGVKDLYRILFDMRTMQIGLRPSSSLSHEGKKQLTARKPGTPNVLVRRNEKGRKYSGRESHKNNSNDLTKLAKQAINENKKQACSKNVYSLHMRVSTPVITVNNEDTLQRDSREKDRKNPQTSLNSDMEYPKSSTIHNESVSVGELNTQDLDETHDVVSNAKREVQKVEENITLKEKEVLNRFTDPQIKESLENIIKRRRSSVRFSRPESGYDLVNLSDIESNRVETPLDQHQQDVSVESESVSESSRDDDSRPHSGPARKTSENHLRLTSGPTSKSQSSHTEGSPQLKALPRKSSRQIGRRTSARNISSPQSCLSTTSNWTHKSNIYPKLQTRKLGFQTGETRVIRPASAKGYKPTLTKRKTRKQSAVSCPESLWEKQKAKNLRETAMVREFLLMYAKVTSREHTEIHKSEPVRMISQTPQLVIKSAIGQFLTSAFPSGQGDRPNARNIQSKAERYEEQQRSKLLRIKICMEHLAAVA